MFRRAKGADAGERLLRRDRRQRGDAAPDPQDADGSAPVESTEETPNVEAPVSRRRPRSKR